MSEPEVFWCIKCIKNIWWSPGIGDPYPICDNCIETGRQSLLKRSEINWIRSAYISKKRYQEV